MKLVSLMAVICITATCQIVQPPRAPARPSAPAKFGDIPYQGHAGATFIPIGGEGACLRIVGGVPTWGACPAGSGGSVTARVFQVVGSVHTSGTVTLTAGSTAVSGRGTGWTSDMDGGFLAVYGPERTKASGQVFRMWVTSSGIGELSIPWDGETGEYVYELWPTTYIPAQTHTLGSRDVGVQCYSAGTASMDLHPALIIRYDNYDIEILWAENVSGYCMLFR